ncbi:unnamed protein product [Amoebophrya sp. A120]|nr:unnamed protein product [Amoebophrya sp. A120]|eukprot:GSA120T00024076001.1
MSNRPSDLPHDDEDDNYPPEEEKDKQQQLKEYREQLQVVDETLAVTPDTDPSYEALKEARQDLQDVIKLLEEVVVMEKEVVQKAPEALQARQQGKLLPDDDRPAQHRGRGHELIGRSCEVHLPGSLNGWYNAEVFNIRRDERGVDRAMLTVFGERERKEVKLSELKMLRALPPAACLPGTKLQAISVIDGLWYDCVVEEHTDRGYIVRFTDYNTKDEVKFDQVRQKIAKTLGGAAAAAGKRPAKEIITPGGYVIPEHFMVKPEDTDEVKAKKKRKIHHVKQQQKDEKQEQDAFKKANGWQKFCQKNTKQKGFIKSNLQKQSIFASSDKDPNQRNLAASSSSSALRR